MKQSVALNDVPDQQPPREQVFAIFHSVFKFTRRAMLFGLVVTIAALFGGLDAITPVGVSRPGNHIALDIMQIKPGGPAENYAAYVPSTVLSVPAHTIVTVTIRNFDLDATPVPKDSTYINVKGTVNGIAFVDGQPYASVSRMDLAHTFTVPSLQLNVPIPGKSASGQHYVTVTFAFRIGNAGTLKWRCFAPCGDGADGLQGPMNDEAYMRGILFVER
jgi:hypothetical protein